MSFSGAFRELLAKAGLPSVVDDPRLPRRSTSSGDYAAFLARSFPYRSPPVEIPDSTRRTRRLRAMTSLTSGPRSTPSRTSSPREASNRRSRSGFSATGAQARPSSWTPCNSRSLSSWGAGGARDAQNAPFWKQIVQINFNAWHYVKGDLWASLVEQVFSGLRVTRDSDDSELAKRQKHWLDAVEAKRQERRGVLGQLDAKTAAQGDAQREFKTAVDERRQEEQKLAEAQGRTRRRAAR